MVLGLQKVLADLALSQEPVSVSPMINGFGWGHDEEHQAQDFGADLPV